MNNGKRSVAIIVSGPARAARRLTLPACGAFSLIELLVTVGIIALLLSLLLPSLAGARDRARSIKCLADLRQMGFAWLQYAIDNNDFAMPLGYWQLSAPIYWWGQIVDAEVDHKKGFLWPYLRADLQTDGVFQCPSQPWGTYNPPLSAPNSVTSTYGYNGYYLSPKYTPGWAFSIGHRPWQRTSTIICPSRTFVFADTLLDFGQDLPNVTALLDPPWKYYAHRAWRPNRCPTTAFRHNQAANALSADGHAESYHAGRGKIVSKEFSIGYVGPSNGCAGSPNAPHYVPDYQDW